MIKLVFKWIRKMMVVQDSVVADPIRAEAQELSLKELAKRPLRHEVINYLFEFINKEHSIYLEIGVRNPADNFDHIRASRKYGVDPGYEFVDNPVEFKMTSNEFFQKLNAGEIMSSRIRFDVIFIDGLHTATQVAKDIENALKFLNEDGFIVLHDCNPPTEFHAREDFGYFSSPAGRHWNGTTWKAFVDFRSQAEYYSCCIDSDWGIGVISKKVDFGTPTFIRNHFFDFNEFAKHRSDSLNLIHYHRFREILTLAK